MADICIFDTQKSMIDEKNVGSRYLISDGGFRRI